MITLRQKLKKNQQIRKSEQCRSRISIRDKLLTKEVQEMQSILPSGASIKFSTPDCLYDFILTLRPSEGRYKGGIFQFSVYVTEEYNMTPPTVKCLTKLWHPNISENGNICLSLLRSHSLDGSGWCPTRTLNDVVWGLDSLFTDLMNFDDPLNTDAAFMFQNDEVAFQNRVRSYIEQYALCEPK